MSFVRILGVADGISALLVLLYLAEIVPWNFVLLSVIFLAAKSIFFYNDIASILDGIVAIVFLFIIFGIQNIFLLGLCVLYLWQKSIRSLV